MLYCLPYDSTSERGVRAACEGRISSSSLLGAVVVTTPSSLATADVVRGIRMLERYSIPVLGIVENMASFQCGKCTELHFPFGREHLADVLARLGEPGKKTCVVSLPIVPNTGVVSSVLAQSSGLELQPHLDKLADALEQSPPKEVLLQQALSERERPHWPTIIAVNLECLS